MNKSMYKKSDRSKFKSFSGGSVLLIAALFIVQGFMSSPANADTKYAYVFVFNGGINPALSPPVLPNNRLYVYSSALDAAQEDASVYCKYVVMDSLYFYGYAPPYPLACGFNSVVPDTNPNVTPGTQFTVYVDATWSGGGRTFTQKQNTGTAYNQTGAVEVRTCQDLLFVQADGSCGPNPQPGAKKKVRANPSLGTCPGNKTTQKGDHGTHCADPINQSTGNLTETQVDYRSSGAYPLNIVRYYNSQATTTGVFGANWSSTYDANVTQVSSTQVVLTMSDGQSLPFTGSNGTWTADGDVNGRLTQTASGWTYTDDENTIDTYNGTGQLVSITRPGGLIQTLTYDSTGHIASETGPFGRTLTMTENSNGQITSITDPSGAVYQYSYDTNNNLTAVTYPDGTSRQYLYEDSAYPHALTGLIDADGTRYTTWTYDSAGRATSSSHANNTDLTSVQYQLDSNNAITSSTVTDPLGAVRTFTYQSIDGLSHTTNETEPDAAGTGTAARTWSFDANGNALSYTDYNGNTTHTTYDASRNLPLTQTDATGRTVTTQWDAHFRLPDSVTVSDTAGHRRTTTYTYDSAGHVLTKTMSDPSTGISRTWSYSYNAQGLLASVDGPRTDVSDVTTYTYDAQGNLATVTNALGQTTTFTAYDADGRLLSVTDPNGQVTQLRYDVRGRLTRQTVGTEVTSYQYDNAGLLTQVTRPDGSDLTYTYDAAHRLTEVDDSLGNRLVYTLDAAGNHTQVQSYDPNGTLQSTRQQVYDQLNRLAQVIGAKGQTTTLQYDDNGNLTDVTDALGHSTLETYDGVNRLIQQVDATGGQTNKTYDAFNDVTSVTDPNGHTTTYTYDNLGEILSQSSPDTGTTTYTYDSAGNVASKTDARGDTTTYAYDALNRVTSATFADGTQTIYQYDQGSNGIGHLSQVSNPSSTITWTYDSYGHVLSKTQQTGGVTLTTSMTYNAAGQLTSLTYPGGDTVGYAYHQGLVSSLTLNGQSLLSNITYQPFGPVNGWTWGDGQTETRDYNTDSQLIRYALPGGARSLSYDKVGNITSVAGSNLAANFGYDALNRLTAANDARFTLGYSYDANGNRLSLTNASGTTSYAYASDSNRLLSLAGVTNQSRQYDANGNLTDDGTHSYTFDARNHLVSVDSGNTATYLYNALGQRVQKTALQPGNAIGAASLSTNANAQAAASQSAAAQHVATVQAKVQTTRSAQAQANSANTANVGGMITTRFAYDINGNLIGQYDSNGNPEQELIRLGRLPVAVVQNGLVYDMYTDQHGAPRAIANSSGTVVWSWDPSPFGNTAANDNPDGDHVKFSFNLRFPGQYYDVETGRNYNNFRYYDPSTGRYITSDPIGLNGGLNTYGYVGGNPLYWVDPYGLEPGETDSETTAIENEIEQKKSGYDKTPPDYDPALINQENADLVRKIRAYDPTFEVIGPASPEANEMLREKLTQLELDAINKESAENSCSVRQKGDRFTNGDDAQTQFEEIEKAQRRYRQGKSNQIIDNIEKSKQRDRNTLRPENWTNWRDHLDE